MKIVLPGQVNFAISPLSEQFISGGRCQFNISIAEEEMKLEISITIYNNNHYTGNQVI